jgi:hypothetical protein
MEDTYIDENGYERDSEDNKLIHRKIAFENIYEPNEHQYPFSFGEYVVHHKDRDKLNNDIENLAILTEEEHDDEHRKDFRKAPKWNSYYEGRPRYRGDNYRNNYNNNYSRGVSGAIIIGSILLLIGLGVSTASPVGVLFLIAGALILMYHFA